MFAFAFALSLLAKVAFDGGVSLGEMASDNVGGEAGPSREEVALDCV